MHEDYRFVNCWIQGQKTSKSRLMVLNNFLRFCLGDARLPLSTSSSPRSLLDTLLLASLCFILRLP